MRRSIALLLSAFLFAACAKVNENEIRVGEFGSLTGGNATFGTTTHEGIQIAVDEINQAGGIKGKMVRLITEDDRSKAEEAATVVEKLITRDKVHAILGEVASSNSLAAAPIAQRHKIPMISPSSTSIKVTQQGDYIFRVCFIDPFQGKVMAKFAKENLKAKTAAILRDKAAAYSMGLADVFAAEFAAMGGKIVLDTAYQTKDVDFKAQLTSIKQKKPEVIFVPGYYTEVGLIGRQARSLGIKQPLLGGDGWESPELHKIAGGSLEGSFFSNHSSPDSKDKAVVDFVAKHQTKYGKAPGALTMLGYDAAVVLFDAMKRAAALHPAPAASEATKAAPLFGSEELRNAIAATKNFPGVTGKISLDAERNAVKSAVVLKIKGDKDVWVATVNP